MAAQPQKERANMATKFTERMAMEEVIALFEALEGTDVAVSTELRDFAVARLAKLDEKNEKRKTSEKAVAKAEADATLAGAILTVLGAKAMASGEVVTALKAKGVDINSSKVASLAGKLADEGKVVKIKGRKNGREVNLWTLAGAESEVEAEG